MNDLKLYHLPDEPEEVPANSVSGLQSVIGSQIRNLREPAVMQEGYLKSANYVATSAGWIIKPNGDVEFNDGTFRGALSAATIDIGGADATSFHVDIDGNLWLGAAAFANGVFKVSNAGAVTATSGAVAAFTLAATTISATNLTITSGAANVANISVGTGSTIAGLNSANTGTDIAIWSGETFANRATAAFRVTAAGAVTGSSFTITGGAITGTSLASVPNSTATDISLLASSHDLVFSVTDADTIAWAAGTIVLSNGRTFTIDAGNTGNMSALTYIYLDTAISTTVLQTTTTYSTAMGANKLLIGTAQNNTVTASFIPFGGGRPLIDGANIGALSIVAGNIAATTITAAKMNVSDLSAISANIGTITSGSISVVSGGNTIGLTPLGTNAIFSGTTGSPEFKVTPAGAVTCTNLTITGGSVGAAVTINGTAANILQPRAETLYQRLVFLGESNDVLDPFATGAGASVTRDIFFCFLTTGTGGTGHASLHYNGSLSSNTRFDWTANPELFFFAQDSGAGANRSTFMGLDSSVADDNGVVEDGVYTAEHAAFMVTSSTVLASSSDGATQQTTDITASVTVTNMNSYRIVVTDASNVKFYVNDVLLATHSTNPPGGTTTDGVAIRFAVDQTSTTAKTLKFGTQYALFSDL